MRRVIFILLLPLLFPTANAQSTNQRSFQVKGLVVSLIPDEKKIEIKHEAIPGYMPAMTMPFEVKTTNELAGLEAGDSISFRLVVTETNGWVEQIKKIASSGTNGLSTAGAVRPIRIVVPLSEGGLLPEYHFTNQLGQAFSTKQFKGQALAITFVFTRCPFPDFCPLMANNFGAAQKRLLAMRNAPANWHLLTISFDPQFDTPAVLKGYAESHNYDPAHWTFATGDLTNIAAIGQQFGLTFWHDETGSITHNLRTVVVDASGRAQKIFANNTWTSDELVVEMLKAAKAK
jgi:protein SCO1